MVDRSHPLDGPPSSGRPGAGGLGGGPVSGVNPTGHGTAALVGAVPVAAAPVTAAPVTAAHVTAAHVTQRMAAIPLASTPAGSFAPPAIPSAAPSAPSVAAAYGSQPVIAVQYPHVGAALRSTRGEYQVQSTIGSGEFGAVYECVGPFDQVYALKMVRPANRPYAEVYAEWALEVQRLLSLRHPNVVYIFDAFEQDNLFYLALERCDHPLGAMLGTPMQDGLVIELARQLLAAVQFLHDNDIIHDDLHPGNVLIVEGHDRPIVKISDFGISTELRGMPAIRPNVVHHAIMAPELIATGYNSRQSDLYQIGLLLYWMLTGESAVPHGVPYQELVHCVAEGVPRLRAEAIGTPLANLVAKMLRRREQFRYGSAREVWADLRALPAWRERQLFPTR